MNHQSIKDRFILRTGYFNQPYKSLRLKNCEITIDHLIPDTYQLSIATPYNERLDKMKHKIGIGAGEVKKCWYFNSEKKVYDFLEGNGIIENI